MEIVLIILSGLLLRLVSINQSLWLDEATSAILTRDFSIVEILTKFSPGDFHPPVYYILIKFWSEIFGTSELGLRSLSVVVGLVGIYMLYILTDKLFNKKVAIVSSILLSTSGLHIYYSQEARMYVLASTLILLTAYYFVKIIEKSRVGDYLLFSLFLCISIATNYMTAFVIPVFWIYGYFKRKNTVWFKRLLVSHFPSLIFGLLWLPTFLSQLTIGSKAKYLYPVWWITLGKSNLKDALLVPVKFMIGRVSWDNYLLYGVIVISLSVFFGSLIYEGYKRNKDKQNYYFICLWLMIPFVCSLVLGTWLSVFSYFRLLYLLPAFYLLIALGVTSFTGKITKTVLASVLIINLFLSGYYLFDPKFHREDWRGLVNHIKLSQDLSKSTVIFVTHSQTEAFKYYDPKGEIRVNGPELIKGGYSTIWLMRYAQPIFDPKDSIRNEVERRGYIKVSSNDFNGVEVWKYMR